MHAYKILITYLLILINTINISVLSFSFKSENRRRLCHLASPAVSPKKGIAILASNFVNNIVRFDSYSTTVATRNSTTTTSARSNSNPDFIFPKGRGFKMSSLNITSLLKHIDELRIVLDGQPIDILAINETRLDGSISDQDVKIVGYDVIRRDRTVNGRFGGGICFYIRSNINYVCREDLDNELLEILSIEILKPNSKPFVVTSWYRPPN